MTTILCGSKIYNNLDLNPLVDYFDDIVRHNMLLPNNNYGTKNSTYQVLNPHIYARYTEKVGFDVWMDHYSEVHGISEEHIKNFLEYLNNPDLNIVNYNENNTSLMMRILHANEIGHNIVKQIRCGFGHMALCIAKGEKPFLVGYSLDTKQALNKQYATKDGTGECHNIDAEIELIKKLHNASLVDASFCALMDSTPAKVDDELLLPTVEALKILGEVYYGKEI